MKRTLPNTKSTILMKRTIPILSIAVMIAVALFSLTACKSKAPGSLVLSASDTSGLAEFKSWKTMNDAKQANESYIQGYKDAIATKAAAPAKPRVIYRTSKPAASTSSNTYYAQQPVVAKKKGISKAAKAAAVGTAAGAVAGALINKRNRVVGGVIGGLLGGGIGYGVGRNMDKKDGRY